MANEFKIKNGLIVNEGGANITGSVYVTGSVTALSFTGSLFGTASWAENSTTSSNSATASYVEYTNVANKPTLFSGSSQVKLEEISGSVFADKLYTFPGDIVVQGNITGEQLIVSTSVYYVTTSFSSGSTIFGNTLDDTHQFTGSVSVTGSVTALSFTGSLYGTASNALSASYAKIFPYTGSAQITGSLEIIGSTTMTGSLLISGSTTQLGNNTLAGNNTISGSNTIVGPSTLTGSFLVSGSTTQIGNNTLTGNTVLSGSIAISGSSTITGYTEMTGSLFITGSTTQTGNNTLIGNTVLSGSITISGSNPSGSLTPSVKIYGNIEQTGYHRFDPVVTNIDTSTSASYIYVSGSTNDLYFSQNGAGYSNTTRLRWLEGNLYTGLLNGGIISATIGSTTYTVSSGSGIIVNLNASYNNNPYPTVQYLNWGNLTGNINNLSASYDQEFISIDSTSNIFAQGAPYANGQYNTLIPIGIVIHQNRSTINAVQTFPSVAYGWKQRSNDFLKAFGPLKISGYTLSPSGSSTGSLVLTGGSSFVDGRNYTIDPNDPSFINEITGITTSKIYRYHQSGSAGWVYNTNAGAGYATIDPANYSNNGTLTPVGTNDWTIQRVFYFPNSATKAFYIYYGNATYTNKDNAVAAINTEAFNEAPNTAANAILVGYLILRYNANFTVAASYEIRSAGLFRGSGTAVGGGSATPVSLAGLSDVSITSPTNQQPLAYNSSTQKWQNATTITANVIGNASTATSASYALTASYAANVPATASYALSALSASYAANVGFNYTASFTNQSVWTVNHNLNYRFVIIQAFDTNYDEIIPENIELNDTNTATVSFPTVESGYVVVSVGGAGYFSTVSASYAATASYLMGSIDNAINAVFAETASWSNNPITVTGSTLYSTVPPAGPDFTTDNSIFLGSTAGQNAFNARSSNFFGNSAGVEATNAIASNFFGQSAGYQATNADNANFLGPSAGQGATNSSYSNFIGPTAGINASDAYFSNFLGAGAGDSAINANNSNFFGNGAGSNGNEANNSNFLGNSAGSRASSASYSNFLGNGAGYSAKYASHSFLAGFQAGSDINETGQFIGPNNIILGTNITLSTGRANAINLGAIIFGTGSYGDINTEPFSGSVGNGKVGINIVNPVYNLDVSGSGNYTGNLTVTGSLKISGSGTLINIGPAQFTGSVTSNAGFTGSLQGLADSSSYSLTASYFSGVVNNSTSASFSTSASLSVSSSFAETASFITTSQTASFVTFGNVANKPTLFSGSSQVQLDQITGTTFADALYTFPGDLTVQGNITAEQLVISTSVYYVTTSFSSGSTRFGNSSDDTHQFTGSIIVTGSITGSLFGTASWSTNAVTAATASSLNGLNQNVLLTGSLKVSGSITGSLLGTASYVSGSVFSSTNPALSASFATTASYASTAQSLLGSVTTAATASYISSLNKVGDVIVYDSATITDGYQLAWNATNLEWAPAAGAAAKGVTRLFVSANRNNANAFYFTAITVTADSKAAPAADTAFLITTNLITKVTIYLREDASGTNSTRVDLTRNGNGTPFANATSSIANSTVTLSQNTISTYTFTGLSFNTFDSLHVKVTPTSSPGQMYGIVLLE